MVGAIVFYENLYNFRNSFENVTTIPKLWELQQNTIMAFIFY